MIKSIVHFDLCSSEKKVLRKLCKGIFNSVGEEVQHPPVSAALRDINRAGYTGVTRMDSMTPVDVQVVVWLS